MFLAGCLRIRRADYEPVNLVVLNSRKSSVSANVEIRNSGDETVYEEEFHLDEENRSERRDNVIEPGSYMFYVTDHDGETYEYDFSMDGCEWNEVVVRLKWDILQSEGFVDIARGQKNCR